MKRRKFLRQFLAATAAVSILAAGPVAAASLEDRVVEQLREQGFESIRISRTWLGRLRIKARGRGYEREIIINPRTGEILRDFWEDEDQEAGLFSPDGRDRDSRDDTGGSDDSDNDDNDGDDGRDGDDSDTDDGGRDNDGGSDNDGGRDDNDGSGNDGGGGDSGGGDDGDDGDDDD
ncbi:MAG: hypothetical protein ACP5DX_05580 [Paracoccaceae bacterium]